MPLYPHLTLDADPNKFAQVIRNLLSNALKFTNHSGTIKVTASVSTTAESTRSIPVSVSSFAIHPTSPSSMLVLTITDSGVGITKVLLPLRLNRWLMMN